MPIYDREKQRIRGWMRWRERGRHKGVDKVAIAHGTQLHAPPRSLCLSLSLSPPLARFLPSFAPSSSSFSSLDHSTHTLHFASLLFTSLLFSSLLFSSLLVSSLLLSSPLLSSLLARPPSALPTPKANPFRYSVFQAPFTTGSSLTSHYPLGISEGTTRSRKSARQFDGNAVPVASFSRASLFLPISIHPSHLAIARDRSRISFPSCHPLAFLVFPINSWKLLLVETRSIGKSFKNRFGTRLFVMDSSPCP